MLASTIFIITGIYLMFLGLFLQTENFKSFLLFKGSSFTLGGFQIFLTLESLGYIVKI